MNNWLTDRRKTGLRSRSRQISAVAGILLTISLFASGCGNSALNSNGHAGRAPAPPAGTMFLYPERIPLQDGGFFAAERGMVFVPINRSQSGSEVIGIELYRFPAGNEEASRRPPIFFLHGGPSFEGLEPSLQRPGTFEDRWAPMTELADVVVVGQRGIGSSKPTTTIGITNRPWPADQPSDEASDRDNLQQQLEQEKASWESAGLDLQGFTVLEAAEDVNAVRQALGYDKIVVWGGSFGSHWGMNLMRLHPEIVERAILRGMEGPDHTYDHPGHLWNVYKRVAEEAEASDELKGLVPEGGLIAAWEKLLDAAQRQPFRVKVTDPETGREQEVLLDGAALKRFSRGLSGDLASWPADILAMVGGDLSQAASVLYRESRSTQRSFTTASFFMLDCGSGITPGRLSEQQSDPANKFLSRMNWIYLAGCPVWNIDLGDDFRQNFKTGIPTVIAHGTWDLSTPYENALELVPYFENSKFIPVERGPHGAIQAAMGASEQFRSGIFHFAATGDWSGLPDKVTLPPVRFKRPEQ